MAEKPPWREGDENPRRRSDIKFSLPGGIALEASGATVTILLLILVVIGVIAAHHYLQDRQDDQYANLMRQQQQSISDRQVENALRFQDVQERMSEGQDKTQRTLAVFTCVLTLNEQQRREFRVEGKYCGDFETNTEIRRVIKPEARK